MIKDSFEPITKNDVKYVTKRAQEVEEPYDLDEAYSSTTVVVMIVAAAIVVKITMPQTEVLPL